jgi:predicted amidophosphoribosyltransferase
MAETLECPNCGAEIERDTRKCGACTIYLKTDLECLRTIDRSLRTLKTIAVWWFVLVTIGAVAYIFGKLS